MTTAPPPGYALVRALTRALLGLFYQRIEVVGRENVPPSGPLIVAANHHNSIVDAMLLIATFERPLHVLANAPLFRHPLIGPFLRLMGGLPVRRRQEAGDDPEKNRELFAATTAALGRGDAIALFPEGRTQPEPALQAVRTGAARMLLAAEEAHPGGPRVTLLPVGLVFDRPGTFREGRALVLIGAPVPTADPVEEGPGAPPPARQITERLRDALRGQIVEADDRATLRLLRLAEEIRRDGDRASAPSEPDRVRWLQAAMRSYRSLLRIDPNRVAAFREELASFEEDARRSGFVSERLFRRYSIGTVARFVAVEGFALLVAAPLALGGLVLHGLPYRLTGWAVTKIPHTDEEEATDKIAAGLVSYPLCWLVKGVAAFAIGRGRALAVFLLALPLTGFFALSAYERLQRFRDEARAFSRFRRDRDAPQRLRRRREALGRELRALAELGEARAGSLA
ncbi:MAG: 1-acyl-sn-glycerol-3-phosphate acyltransferase [Syntrophomonadaceae bacterium]